MKTTTNFSNATTLGVYRFAIQNAEAHERISKALAEIGYGAEKLEEGKSLLEETQQAFLNSNKGRDLKNHHYRIFSQKTKELADMFEDYRKRAEYLFLDNPVIARQLSAKGSLPAKFDKWIEAIRKSYMEALANPEIQEKLAGLKVTPESLNAGLTKIEEVEMARAEYMRYKGDSQDFTQTKDKTFEKLNNWMKSFYLVAKLGLKENPQLMEPLGKVVK